MSTPLPNPFLIARELGITPALLLANYQSNLKELQGMLARATRPGRTVDGFTKKEILEAITRKEQLIALLQAGEPQPAIKKTLHEVKAGELVEFHGLTRSGKMLVTKTTARTLTLDNGQRFSRETGNCMTGGKYAPWIKAIDEATKPINETPKPE